MKRKLMLLFGLFCLLIPITGCGEDDSGNGDGGYNVSVDVSLVKADVVEADGKDFIMSDCARIVSGKGNYSSNSNPQLIVEYYSNACQITYIEMDENRYDTFSKDNLGNNLERIQYPIDVRNDEDRNINVKVGVIKKNQSLATSKVVFAGVTMQYSTNSGSSFRELANEEVKFPYMSIDTNNSNNDTMTGIEKGTYPSGDSSVNSSTPLSMVFSTRPLNLNYIYINDVFQPYKLTWRKGTYSYSNSLCSFSSDANSLISDINNFNDYNQNQYTCLGAVIDTTAGLDDTIKELAIDNLVKNKVYIVDTEGVDVNDEHIKACLEATPSNSETLRLARVSQDCMYVLNLKDLYIDDASIANPKAFYYGVNSNNNLEGISTTNVGKLQYAICDNAIAADGTSINDTRCTRTNTFVMDYEHDYSEGTTGDSVKININYKTLAIDSFIDVLETSISSNGKISHNISSDDITFDYSPIVQDIVPVKIGNYRINYIGVNVETDSYAPIISANQKIVPTITFSSSTLTPVNKYELVFDVENFTSDIDGEFDKVKTAMDEVINSISSNTLNLILQQEGSKSELWDKIRVKLREIVNTDVDNTMDVLQKYMYKSNILDDSVDNNTISIGLELATISKPNDVYVKYGEDAPVVCHILNTNDCLDENGDNYAGFLYEDMEEMLAILQGDDFSTIKDIYIVDSATNTIAYVITKDRIDTTITYTPGTGNQIAEFKLSDSDLVIKYLKGEEKTYFVSSIKYEQVTAIGTINQLLQVDLNNKNYSISTTIGENNVTASNITNSIINTLGIFYENLTEDAQPDADLMELIKGKFYDMGDNGYVFVWEETIGGDTKVYARFMEVIDSIEDAIPTYNYTDANSNLFEITLSTVDLGDDVCGKSTC